MRPLQENPFGHPAGESHDVEGGDLEFTYLPASGELPSFSGQGGAGAGAPRSETPDDAEEPGQSPALEAMYAVFSHLAASVGHEIAHPAGVVRSNGVTLAGYAKVIGQLLRLYDALAEAVAKHDRQGLAEHMRRIKQIQDGEEVSFLLEDLPRLVAESEESSARLLRIGARISALRTADRQRPNPRDLRAMVDRAVEPTEAP